MSIIAGDWTIDRSNGDIRYVGDDHSGSSPSYATVLELYRWLQELADDAIASGDDELDITNENPGARSTDNIITLLGNYNIDANASEHLYDGSIIQNDGDDIYDGFVNFGNSDVQIQIIQNGVVLADDWWNYNGGGLNADSANGISHRFMLPVKSSGNNIDGRRIIGICRRFGYTYGEFRINGTARGNNVLALTDAVDLNNSTSSGVVAGWTTITNSTEGYAAIDVNNDGVDDYFYSEWDKDTYTINQFYERMKYLTRDGSSETLYNLSGELFRGITHEIDVDSPSGTFSETESVSWSSGSGQMLAINSTTSPTKMWIQLLTGVPPTDGQSITGGTSGASCSVDSNVIDRSSLITTPFIGASTGSSLIGGYGVGVEYDDLTNADKLFDLANSQKVPPNNVTNTVAGLVTGEDRVLVAPWDGSTTDTNGNPAIEKDQLSLSTALTTDNISSVVVAEDIPSDTPTSGYIRVADNNGFERRLHYTSWNNKTFSIDTTDGNEDFNGVNASSGNNVYIAYIDILASSSSQSFTGVYSVDRDLVVIVRDGGSTPIKEFISAWSFTGSAQTITAIRTTDA
jgi:hypothetical protein